MPDTKITTDNSTNQIRHSNPAVSPLPASAGQAIVVTKGGNIPSVHGQVSAGGVNIFGPVFDNPGV